MISEVPWLGIYKAGFNLLDANINDSIHPFAHESMSCVDAASKAFSERFIHRLCGISVLISRLLSVSCSQQYHASDTRQSIIVIRYPLHA